MPVGIGLMGSSSAAAHAAEDIASNIDAKHLSAVNGMWTLEWPRAVMRPRQYAFAAQFDIGITPPVLEIIISKLIK
jgi:hypothetical protein